MKGGREGEPLDTRRSSAVRRPMAHTLAMCREREDEVATSPAVQQCSCIMGKRVVCWVLPRPAAHSFCAWRVHGAHGPYGRQLRSMCVWALPVLLLLLACWLALVSTYIHRQGCRPELVHPRLMCVVWENIWIFGPCFATAVGERGCPAQRGCCPPVTHTLQRARCRAVQVNTHTCCCMLKRQRPRDPETGQREEEEGAHLRQDRLRWRRTGWRRVVCGVGCGGGEPWWWQLWLPCLPARNPLCSYTLFNSPFALLSTDRTDPTHTQIQKNAR